MTRGHLQAQTKTPKARSACRIVRWRCDPPTRHAGPDRTPNRASDSIPRFQGVPGSLRAVSLTLPYAFPFVVITTPFFLSFSSFAAASSSPDVQLAIANGVCSRPAVPVSRRHRGSVVARRAVSNVVGVPPRPTQNSAAFPLRARPI